MNKKGAYRKKNLNIENVKARHEWLLAAIDKPEKITQRMLESISNQRRFAAMTIPGTSVTPLSLNTIKHIADFLFSDNAEHVNGFVFFDSLRLNLNKISRCKSGQGLKGIAALSKAYAIQEMSERLRSVELQNILRSKAYFDLFGKINNLIEVPDIDETTRVRLFKILQSHTANFGELLSSSAPALNTDGAILTLVDGGRDG
jgi:hypothetical protein